MTAPFPHLRAAFAIAVRWEGVVLGLVPAQVMLLCLYLAGGLPPWGEPLVPEETLLGLSAMDWGVVAGALLSGISVVLLVPLVLDRRGLDFALLRRWPLAVIAAAALPYLVRKAAATWGLESVGVVALVVEPFCSTVLPAWLAARLVAADFGARTPSPTRTVLVSAALVLVVVGLLAAAELSLAIVLLLDSTTISSEGALALVTIAVFHVTAWQILVAQAWFLRRIFARAPNPEASA